MGVGVVGGRGIGEETNHVTGLEGGGNRSCDRTRGGGGGGDHVTVRVVNKNV